VDRSGALAGKSIAAIAAGAYQSLALTTDGLLFAWGHNADGQLVAPFFTGTVTGAWPGFVKTWWLPATRSKVQPRRKERPGTGQG